jgi:hypothetical protein
VLVVKLLIVLLLTILTLSIQAEQWQEVPLGMQRLKPSPESKENSPPSTIPPAEDLEEDTPNKTIPPSAYLDSSLYPLGEGEILGAFGISFTETLDNSLIISELGWRPVEKLPGGLKYKESDLALDFETFHIKPPSTPSLMSSKGITYTVTLDFDGKPLSIQAEGILNIKDIIPVLKRKYGEANTETTSQITFLRGNNALYIEVKRNRASLRYYNIAALGAYIKRREINLIEKYQSASRELITDTERRIFLLADQFLASRKTGGGSFGLSFQNRIGFLAKPDEYIALIGANALKGLTNGQYLVMVSPELMPITMRYEIKAPKSQLSHLKTILDHALLLTYGGFLKKTTHHSVIAFSGIAISVLIRSGKLSLSIVNSAENKLYNKRENKRLLAKQEAEALRLKRLADIKQKKLDKIASMKREKELAVARKQRKKEIKEETGF